MKKLQKLLWLLPMLMVFVAIPIVSNATTPVSDGNITIVGVKTDTMTSYDTSVLNLAAGAEAPPSSSTYAPFYPKPTNYIYIKTRTASSNLTYGPILYRNVNSSGNFTYTQTTTYSGMYRYDEYKISASTFMEGYSNGSTPICYGRVYVWGFEKGNIQTFDSLSINWLKN